MITKSINPFLSTLRVPYIEYVTDRDFIGENKEVQYYGYEVESEKHFRVYSSVIIKEFLFKKLTIYARDLLSAIQHFTNTDYLHVIISFEKVKELYGNQKVSRRRYDDTIRELVRNAVIDYKDKAHNQYWYNPAYFAPGSRLSLFEQCKFKVKTERAGKRKLKS